MGKPAQDDLLDHTIKFLQKREGIDKTLKLIRYTSRLIAAVTPKDAELNRRCSALEKSVGVSRKAFRLGKFLQDANNFRNSKATGPLILLEAVAYGGEGVYYFLEQFSWLIKTGAMTKEHEAQIARASAWAEFVGYLANIWLGLVKLQELQAKREKLQSLLDKKRKEEGVLDSALERELSLLRGLYLLKVAAVVQDLADSTLAVNDIRGGADPLLSHPVTLALAGLVSGSISFYKNWNA